MVSSVFPISAELSMLCCCPFRSRGVHRCSLPGGEMLPQCQASWVPPSMGQAPVPGTLNTRISQGCVNPAEEAIQRRESFRPNPPPGFACLHARADLQRVASVKETTQQLSFLQFAGRQWKSHLTSLAISLSTVTMRGLDYINSVLFPYNALAFCSCLCYTEWPHFFPRWESALTLVLRGHSASEWWEQLKLVIP